MSTHLLASRSSSTFTPKNSTQWTERRIGDDCAIGNGTHAKLKRHAEGVMYLTAKNFKEDGLNLWRVDYISEQDYNRLFRENSMALTKPAAGDVLLGIIGTIGRPYLVKPQDHFGLSSSVAIIRPDASVLWPPYLYYWVKSHIFQNALQSITGGVVQAYVSLSALKSLPLKYPDIDNQRKIAAILSTYDSAIANNLQRVQILESMVRAIYREWFVHFRFPGSDRVKLVECPYGLIPEGWQLLKIGEVIETVSGDTPSTKNPLYWDNGDLTWFTPTDLTAAGTMFVTESSRKITPLGLRKTKARLFPPYSVMMTSRATIGVVAINTRTACTNQGFITCIPNEQLSAYYLYFWIDEHKDHIATLSSGVMFKEIYQSQFRNLPIPIPDPVIHRSFVTTVDPICKQIDTLHAQISNLRRTRNLLLSRLISGQINVEDLEINVDEVEELPELS